MTSLSKNARVAGLLYILASAVGIVRLMYIPKTLIVHGNAAATAGNLVAHELVFRLGWLAFSFTGLLLPEHGGKVLTSGQPLMLGEVATMLWLLIMGAKEPLPPT
jgi:hypothetical protein